MIVCLFINIATWITSRLGLFTLLLRHNLVILLVFLSLVQVSVMWWYRYAVSFAGNYLKLLYVGRTPKLIKTLHIVSSGFKAILTWHNMRTLQVGPEILCLRFSFYW